METDSERTNGNELLFGVSPENALFWIDPAIFRCHGIISHSIDAINAASKPKSMWPPRVVSLSNANLLKIDMERELVLLFLFPF